MLTTRLLLMNGLAITMVAVHHATGYGIMALFSWTDRYLPVTVPDYSQIGTFPYYITIAIQHLDWMSLPALTFVSGFFISTATRMNDRTIQWNVIYSRIKYLLIPFAIWTVIFFVFFVRRPPLSVDELFDRYYFIPLLMIFLLLAPAIVPIARKYWKTLLLAAAFLELGRFSLRYFLDLGIEFPGQMLLIELTPRWLPPNLLFWFALGVVVGFRRKEFVAWLKKVKWYALAGLIIFALLMVIEYRLVSQAIGVEWLGPYWGGYSRYFYSLSVIIAFLAFEKVHIPFSKHVSNLGSKSLGIYLVHSRWMWIAALVMYRLTPWALGYQVIYQGILIVVSIGGCLLLMRAMNISPFRRYYRYIFG